LFAVPSKKDRETEQTYAEAERKMDMLKRYETAPFEQVSTDYSVQMDGQKLHVFPVRVSAMPVDQIFRGRQRGLDETELAAYVHFEGDEAAEMTVTVGFDVFRAVIVPRSAGVRVIRDGRTLRFTLRKYGYYVLEINGVHKPLHIFFDPIETNIPDRNDPDVLYFDAGIHNTSEIRLHSNQTLYLEGGARIMGNVLVEDAENVRICGRGVIDTSLMPRQSGTNCVRVIDSKNVLVEGVILHDAPVYAMTVGGGEKLRVERVKVIGQWRYNADGIDLHNIQDAVISHCFVRTFDDSIVIKGVHKVGGRDTQHMSVKNILVEKCVLWNDWGRALEIGAETCAEEMCNIVFQKCEVLHFLFMACDVQACGDAFVHDIVFENIRVGEPLDPQCEPRLCEIFIRPMCWIRGDHMGRVENVTFRNISYQGRTCVPCRLIGYREESDIRNVYFENVSVNGEPVTAAGHPMSRFIYNEFASGIEVDGENLRKEHAHLETEEETCDSFLIGNGAFITL